MSGKSGPGKSGMCGNGGLGDESLRGLGEHSWSSLRLSGTEGRDSPCPKGVHSPRETLKHISSYGAI